MTNVQRIQADISIDETGKIVEVMFGSCSTPLEFADNVSLAFFCDSSERILVTYTRDGKEE
jgi:hypothetical protein